jgi:glycosyltransferase involved in cell wall biosynthesis
MTRLARRNTVIYLEPRVYLSEAVRKARSGALGRRELRAPTLRHERDGLYVYRDPAYAPYAGRLSGGPLTSAIRRRALRGALQSLGAGRPILWLLRPYHADLIGQHHEKLVVYHVTDEYSGFPMISDKAGFLAAEEALLRRADLVIVTSPALLAAKGKHNPQTHLVRNGVDYAGFSAALASGQQLPALSDSPGALPHPRVGYVGALNEKVDYALLEQVARSHPDWHLVLVGALDLMVHPDRADGLKRLPNVHWLGRVPVDQVPLAIAGMDVCVLPYENNAWTANIDSLKLYEYLACGRPVIATEVPAARAFPGLVQIASDPESFAREIADALAEGPSKLKEARQAAAAANTWDVRVTSIETLLIDALERKGGRQPQPPRPVQ